MIWESYINFKHNSPLQRQLFATARNAIKICQHSLLITVFRGTILNMKNKAISSMEKCLYNV